MKQIVFFLTMLLFTACSEFQEERIYLTATEYAEMMAEPGYMRVGIKTEESFKFDYINLTGNDNSITIYNYDFSYTVLTSDMYVNLNGTIMIDSPQIKGYFKSRSDFRFDINNGEIIITTLKIPSNASGSI